MSKKRIVSIISILILMLFVLSGCDLFKTPNTPPIANAGPDQNAIIVGTKVTLDGSNSSDPDGDPLTFIWKFSAIPSDSSLSDFKIQNPTAKIAYFTPDKEGTYILDLAVSDGTSTVTDSVNINVVPAGTAGVLQFSSASYSVNENGGSVSISVTRTGGSSGAVGVSYATSNGTATAGSDFVSNSGTLSWADGETITKSFSVAITDDIIYEGDETFTVSLSAPSGGASVGNPNTSTVTIVDNESPPPAGVLQFKIGRAHV